MQLFVKGLDTTVLDVCENETVESLKERLSNSEGIPADEQVLTFAGKPLDDDESLEAFGITDMSTISLEVRMLGGEMFTITISKQVYLLLLAYSCA